MVEPREHHERLEPADRRAEIAVRPGRVQGDEQQVGHDDLLGKREHHRDEDETADGNVFHNVRARPGDPVERFR